MAMKIIFLAISLVVSTSLADDCPGAIGDNWVYSENIGRCFRYISTPMSWKAAQKHCSSLGFAGSLAFLNNQEVSQFARTAVTTAADAIPEWLFIGITDEGHEGEWAGTDGEKPDETPFRAGQPDNHGGNEHYVHVNGQTWEWNDIPVSAEYPFICQVEPADVDTVRCPMNWQQHGDLCYKYIDSRLNWYDAQERCSLLGNEGELAFVGCKEDNDNVFEAAGTEGDFWIGVTDECHEGVWSSKFGEVTQFLNWRPNEPNDLSGEDCVHITSVDREWNDLGCGKHTRPFVCQKSAKFSRSRCPPGDGWVQRGENCYQYYQQSGTWEEALAQCRQLGPDGTLPFIRSEAENNEVYEAAARSAGGECVDNFKNFWIGITDHVDDSGAWTDPDGMGSLAIYSAWAPGEPNDAAGNEGYAEMYKGTKTWNDENGSEDAFVCRVSAEHAEPECNAMCPALWTAYNGACYMYNGKKVSWQKAKDECVGLGANLVSHLVRDGEEHKFLGDYIALASGGKGKKKFVTAWIDLNDKDVEGNFVWHDGEAHEGNVDQKKKRKKKDCVIIKTGVFEHEKCGSKRAFVCKQPQL
ncbi:macrophage mannose receptor 1-like [Amphiura filiformis]|uniref:macrophage mannose receptor 1-like n=1 Tax=Amphiura filiformis TaxID=82378 RepID=UPI003B20C142